jgi:thioredoxin reductase (NADPH)
MSLIFFLITDLISSLKSTNISINLSAGDSTCEELTFLTKFSNVIQIHRRDSFRASSIMQKKVLNDPKITVVYDTIVTELLGQDSLEAITIKNVKTGEETRLEVDGLFYGLGLKPNSTLFKGLLEMDEENYIIKYPFEKLETMTSVKGIFVAGDVSDKVYRQAVVAAGDGCKAALDVNTYINEHL